MLGSIRFVFLQERELFTKVVLVTVFKYYLGNLRNERVVRVSVRQ